MRASIDKEIISDAIAIGNMSQRPRAG